MARRGSCPRSRRFDSGPRYQMRKETWWRLEGVRRFGVRRLEASVDISDACIYDDGMMAYAASRIQETLGGPADLWRITPFSVDVPPPSTG